MAELPTLQRRAIAQQIRITDTGVNETQGIGNALAGVSDTLSSSLRPTARAQSQTKGMLEAAATPFARDAQGNLIAPQLRPNSLSIADAEYNAALRQRFSDEIRLVAQDRINGIAIDNSRDPVAFMETAQAYIDSTAENIPEIYQQIYRADVETYRNQIYRGLEEQRREVERARSIETAEIVSGQIRDEAVTYASVTGLANEADQQQVALMYENYSQRQDMLVADQAISAGVADGRKASFYAAVAYGYLENQISKVANSDNPDEAQKKLEEIRIKGRDAPISVPGLPAPDMEIPREQRHAMFDQLMQRGDQIVQARRTQRTIDTNVRVSQLVTQIQELQSQVETGVLGYDAALEAISDGSRAIRAIKGGDPTVRALALEAIAQEEARVAGWAMTSSSLETTSANMRQALGSLPASTQQFYIERYKLTEDMILGNLSNMTIAQRRVALARNEDALRAMQSELDTKVNATELNVLSSMGEYLMTRDATIRKLTQDQYNSETLVDAPQDVRDSIDIQVRNAMATNFNSRAEMTKSSRQAIDDAMSQPNPATPEVYKLKRGAPLGPNDWPAMYAAQARGESNAFDQALKFQTESGMASESAFRFLQKIGRSMATTPESVERTQMQTAARMAALLSRNALMWGKIKGQEGVEGRTLDLLANMGRDPDLLERGGITEEERGAFLNSRSTIEDAEALKEARRWAEKNDVAEAIRDQLGGDVVAGPAVPAAGSLSFSAQVSDRADVVLKQQRSTGRDYDKDEAVAQAIVEVSRETMAMPSRVMWVGQSSKEWGGSRYMAPLAPGAIWQKRHADKSQYESVSGNLADMILLDVDLSEIVGYDQPLGKIGTDVLFRYEATEGDDVLYSLVYKRNDQPGQMGAIDANTGQPWTAIVRYSAIEDFILNKLRNGATQRDYNMLELTRGADELITTPLEAYGRIVGR